MKGARRVRKTRSSGASKRRTKKTQKTANNPALVFDIVGLALIFACPILLIALTSEHSAGYIGKHISTSLRSIFGIGSYIIPFLLAMAGGILMAGPAKLIPRNIGIGSIALFFVVITWASFGDIVSQDTKDLGGGYVGDALGFVLYKGMGETIGYIVLTLLAVISFVVIVDVPISSLIEKAKEALVQWKETKNATPVKVSAEKPAKPAKSETVKTDEPDEEEDSRRRTLARIFSNKNQEKEDEAATPPEPKAPVAIKSSDREMPSEDYDSDSPDNPFESFGEFTMPSTGLLDVAPPAPARVESELQENMRIIEQTLEEFKVSANVVEIAVGPTVARYEIRLAPGIRVNKIVGLADNLAMQLAAIDVRLEAPIPGKAAIGVEVPNKKRGTVVLREIVESDIFKSAKSKLSFALGKDVSGKPVVADLVKMPHMLVGGATNSGKSVGLNTLIASLLYRCSPDELKFIMIDPKRVELTQFDGIPHLACPVVKDAKMAANILRAVVVEMDSRYDLLTRTGARNIDSYNAKVGEDEKMPYMVVVVDELCDLMMQAAAEVEDSIMRLAQLARATGIHLVLATQRPSVDVITGVIKANISSRIAFGVSSHVDSRTILDQKGAERLIGRGDMLFLPMDASKPVRIQGCYVSEEELARLCEFLKSQRKPSYTIQPVATPTTGGGGDEGGGGAIADEYFEPSVRFVVNTGYCSTSMLQRKFKIGYTRAARIVDAMEEQGIVGALDGAKPRQVMITKADLQAVLGGQVGMRLDEDETDEDAPYDDMTDDDDDSPLPAVEVISENNEDEEEI